MKKHITQGFFLITLTLLFAMLLTGCGLKNVSEKQILSDLRENNEIQSCFYSEYVPFSLLEVQDCEVSREQFNKDDKEDVIFCNVTATNEYFRATLETKLLYNYYDKGGWILDEMSYSLSDICALKAPDSTYVESTIKACTSEEFSCNTPYRIIYFDNNNRSLPISGTELSEDGKSAFVHCCHETPDGTKYYGDYSMILELDGWKFPDMYFNGHQDVMFMEMTDSTQDFSKAVGEFYDPWDNGYLTITSIKNDVVTYSLHSDSDILKNRGFEQGDNLTAPFDSKFGAFLEILYMPREDEWVFGAVSFERVTR